MHDAFFKYQTKSRMSLHGEMYHEGKEHEVSLRSKKPGEFSEELMRALGMKDGRHSAPPFLFNMQRFGPPPAYPKLKIPGVNCPIPPGCRYGYNDGEWGKPPVDEYGRPLYGDVFGTEKRDDGEDQISKTYWGLIEAASAEEPTEGADEDNDEVMDMKADQEMETDIEQPDADVDAGIKSVSSVASGMETPEAIQLRKKDKDGTGTETPDSVRDVRKQPKQLYTVIEEKKAAVGSSLFGTEKTYVIPPAGAGAAVPTAAETEAEKKKAKALGQVNVALNPEELEGLDAATLKKKYDAQIEVEKKTEKEQQAAKQSGIDEAVDEERQKKKRKTKQDKEKKKDKYKF